MPILHALEQSGAVVESFYTEEPSIEEIYLRYVNEKSTRDSFGAC